MSKPTKSKGRWVRTPTEKDYNSPSIYELAYSNRNAYSRGYGTFNSPNEAIAAVLGKLPYRTGITYTINRGVKPEFWFVVGRNENGNKSRTGGASVRWLTTLAESTTRKDKTNKSACCDAFVAGGMTHYPQCSNCGKYVLRKDQG